MSFKELVLKNRSYRRFDHSHMISRDQLVSLIDLARQTPSAANLQPLKYHISVKTELNQRIYGCLSWAAYLKNWDGPLPDERPAAYITILLDTTIKDELDCDHGIAAQTILLGAAEQNISGCILASIQRNNLCEILELPDHLKILLVLALGKGKEIIKLEKINDQGDIRYWRDENQVHHVPKRSLKEIIIS